MNLSVEKGMHDYKIFPIKTGEFVEHEKSKLTYGSGFGIKLKTPIPVFLICGEGRQILVDTGACDESWSRKHHSSKMVRTEDMMILPALERLNVKPRNLDFIVNTHLHYDHAFGNPLFPGIDIYVQKREIEFAENPLPTFHLTYESEQCGMTPQWKRNLKSLKIIDGDAEIAPGISLILLPGHSPGLQGVLVDTLSGRYLIASDFIGCMENWLGNGRLKHIPPGSNVSQYDCFASFRKIESLEVGNRILPGHDMSLFEHAVYPFE
jgi:glyoxylase-like metal-dependent hydrolase (beta-lactamase superfamily II)